MQEESFNIDCDISFINIDQTENKTSFTNWDSSSVTCKVLGRKINSAAMLSNNPESICKYPLPIQITSFKVKRVSKRQFQDISNKPHSQNSKHSLKSKTPEPSRPKPPKHLDSKDSKKQIFLKPSKKPQKLITVQKPSAKKTKISIEIPLTLNENSIAKKNIDSIVLQTLKKQKIQKKKDFNQKTEEKNRQKEIKKHLAELNKNTRVENLSRFKQEKFQPLCPWGTDERRITRVNETKVLKEAEELRKKRREERERSKSAGKSRIGLDVIKLKKEPSRIEDDEILPKRQSREKDKSILDFMKKQKMQRHRSKELQIEKAREEENKRLQQLLELEKLTRVHQKRNKSQKSNKKNKHLKKCSEDSYEESLINDSEDDEVMNILHGVRSVSPNSYEIHPNINSFDFRQSGRECMVFGVFPDNVSLEHKANVTQLVNDIVEKREKIEKNIVLASNTMPLADVKASYSVVNTEEEYRESVSSDISKRKDEIRKKLTELRHRVDKAKKHESQDYDAKYKAATKIQAWIRGWLTREALKRYFEENQDSENWLYHQGLYSESEYSGRMNAENSELESFDSIPNQKSSKKNIEIEKILKTQIEWRLIQKHKLVMLKNKDLEDMRTIAKKVGSEEVLMQHFEQIIERRYDLIEQLFDENIEAVKSAVKQAIEENDQESLLQTLEKQENFASEIFQNLENNEEMEEFLKLKHQFDFKNIWQYSDNDEQSIRISELEFESPSGRTQSDKPQSSESFQSFVVNLHKDSGEFFVDPVKITGMPVRRPGINSCDEPIMCVFSEDVIDILEDLIGQEIYIETLENVWDNLLCSNQFVNSVAEVLLNRMILGESEYLAQFDLTILFKKKTPAVIPSLNFGSLKKTRIFMDEDYILHYIRMLFDHLLLIKYELERFLNVPNVLEPVDMLGRMQEAEIGVVIEKTNSNRILPLSLYLELEKEPKENGPLQEYQDIHNKLVFEVVNEQLQKRCKKAEPMPWSFELRILPQKPVYVNKILGSIIEEIKDLNMTRAGKTPKIEFISNSQDTEEDLISQIREEQLSSILSTEIASQEPSWINYEFEETQVKLDLSDMTLEELVEETVKILNVYN